MYSVPFSKGHRPPSEGSGVVLDAVEVQIGVTIFEDPLEMLDEMTEGPVRTFEETPDVGVVELADPLKTTDGELKIAGPVRGGPLVGTIGEGVAVDVVELVASLGACETEFGKIAVVLGGLEELGGALEAGAVELTETTGPEETAVPRVLGEPEEPLEVERGEVGACETELETIAVVLDGLEEPGEALEAGAVELTETTEPEEIAVPKVPGVPEEPLEVERGEVRTALFDGEGVVAVVLEDNGLLLLVGAVPLEVDMIVAFAGEVRTVAVVVRMLKSIPEVIPSLYSITVIVLV